MILHRLLEALFANRVSIVTTSNFHARRPLPERPAPRAHPAGDRAAEGQARGRRRRQRRPTTGRRTLEQVELYHTPLGAGGRRGDGRGVRAPGRGARTRARCCSIEHREIRARRRAGGVVWFDFTPAVRRPALAERLPRARDPVPHAAAVGRAADVAAAGLGGAALHLAGRRALRPPRQAHHVGRGRARGVCTPRGRWRTSSRAPCRGCARCSRPSSWPRRAATSTRRSHESRIRPASLAAACAACAAALARRSRRRAPARHAPRRRGRARARSRAERAAVEARYARAGAASAATRFVVTSCIDEAQARAPRGLDVLRRAPAALDEAQRRERRRQRSAELARKAADDARREQERAARAASAPAPRGAAAARAAARAPAAARRRAAARRSSAARARRRATEPAAKPARRQRPSSARARGAQPGELRDAAASGRGAPPGSVERSDRRATEEPTAAPAAPLPAPAVGAGALSAARSAVSCSTRTSASDRLSPLPRARWRALPTSISLASRGGSAWTMAPSSRGVK